jgi:hypothetical protein
MERKKDILTPVQRSGIEKFQATEIKRLAEFVYGPRFAAQLARKLRLHPSTIRKWTTGARSPTAQHSIEFAVLVQQRRGARVRYEVLLFEELAHVTSPKLEAILLIPYPAIDPTEAATSPVTARRRRRPSADK